MEQLKKYSVKQLKNIITAHNASEKANVIKNYRTMKKPDLISAIEKQIKEEHLSTILEALRLIERPSTPRVDLAEMLSDTEEDDSPKMSPEEENKIFEDFLAMMEKKMKR